MGKITTIIFDLGGVLLDWNPRYLYRQLLPDEESITAFLEEIDFPALNRAVDIESSWDGVFDRWSARYPHRRELIEAFRLRWEVTLPGAIPETVRILEELDAKGWPLYALTNFSRHTFGVMKQRHAFLGRFLGIVSSGEEGVAKPNPDIYRRLLERYKLEPKKCLFIDDSLPNLLVAEELGLHTHHFLNPADLRKAIEPIKHLRAC